MALVAMGALGEKTQQGQDRDTACEECTDFICNLVGCGSMPQFDLRKGQRMQYIKYCICGISLKRKQEMVHCVRLSKMSRISKKSI